MKTELRFGKYNLILRATRVVFFLGLFGAFIFAVPSVSAQTGGSIFGKVFNDFNVNAHLNIGEPGLSGWQVNLIQNNKIIDSALTAADGSYGFSDVAPGDYKIEPVVPKLWAETAGGAEPVVIQPGRNFEVNLGNYQVVGQSSIYGPMLQISNYSVQAISPNRVKVIWFSNYQATGQVVFENKSRTGIDLASNDATFGYEIGRASCRERV